MSNAITNVLPVPVAAGLPDTWQVAIQQRYLPTHQFIVDNLVVPAEVAWRDVPTRTDRAALKDALLQFEIDHLGIPYKRMGKRNATYAAFSETYIQPLAAVYGVPERVRLRLVQRHRAQGLFNVPVPGGAATAALSVADIVETLARVYDPTRLNARQIPLLLEAGLCATPEQATAIITMLDSEPQSVLVQTHAILQAAVCYGWIGLLAHTACDMVDELYILQRRADVLEGTPDEITAAVGSARRDLVVLHVALNGVTRQKRHSQQQQSLWQQHLLHLPVHDFHRQEYRAKLTASEWEHVLYSIVKQGYHTHEVAHVILDALIGGGADHLLARHHHNRTVTDGVRQLTQQRITQAVEHQYASLNPDARQTILQNALALDQASYETGSQLSVVRLMRDPLRSPYRRRVGRRLSFGLGYIKKQHAQRKRRGLLIKRPPPPNATPPKPNEEPATSDTDHDKLLKRFAALTNRALNDDADRASLRNTIRNVISSGGIAFLPQAEWTSLIHPSLLSALDFFKMSRLDGALGWQQILQRVQAYAVDEGLPPPSAHVARLIYNRLSKPTRWHGGVGEALGAVRQRATLMLKAARLHEHWIVAHTMIKLQLGEGQRTRAVQRFGVVIIVDLACQRPVGYAVSTGQPDSTTVGLALYQAIWQPGRPYSPLRGVPDTILLPDYLVADGTDDLRRAAQWMMSTITILTLSQHTNRLNATVTPIASSILDSVQQDFPSYVQKQTRVPHQSVHVGDVHRLLGEWFYPDPRVEENSRYTPSVGAQCFPHHRSPQVPLRFRTTQCSLPGHRLPCAGWLLPVNDTPAITIRNGVNWRGRSYTSSCVDFQPGVTVNIRTTPMHLVGFEPGLFVRDKADQLRYLTLWLDS